MPLIATDGPSLSLEQIGTGALRPLVARLPLQAVLSLRATSSRLLGCTALVEILGLERLAFPIAIPHAAAVLRSFPALSTLTFRRHSLVRSTDCRLASPLKAAAVSAPSEVAGDSSGCDGTNTRESYALPPVPSPMVPITAPKVLEAGADADADADAHSAVAPYATALPVALTRGRRSSAFYDVKPIAAVSAATAAAAAAAAAATAAAATAAAAAASAAAAAPDGAKTTAAPDGAKTTAAVPPAGLKPPTSDGTSAVMGTITSPKPSLALGTALIEPDGRGAAALGTALESAAAESIGSLLAAADCFGSLHRLALPGNDIFASGAEEIARALGRLAESAASSASSANNAASSAGVVGPAVNARYGAVDAGAVGPLRLRQLDLSDTKLSLMWEEGRLTQRPELVSKLLKGLGRAPMLTHLSLGGNMLCELAAKAVSTWLCQPSCRLQSLDFSRNPLGDAGGEQLVKALRTNASLSTLHLDECMLTDATCLRAIKALRRNKGSLRKLTLAWNGIEVLAAPLEQS